MIRPPSTRLRALIGAAFCATMGCKGAEAPLDPRVSQDDAAVTDASRDADLSRNDGGVADKSTDGSDRILQPISAPPASDDQRLATFLAGLPGEPSNGWDTCPLCAPLVRAPNDCTTCPASPAGTTYLRYATSVKTCTSVQTTSVPPPVYDAQIYAYFTPALAADQPQGLWFDMVHIAGDVADTTLTIYATDTGCLTEERLGTWGLAPLLAGDRRWQTSCLTLRPSAPMDAIGFSFTGENVDFGFAALRFGPACPSP